jgi:hypothetical protein
MARDTGSTALARPFEVRSLCRGAWGIAWRLDSSLLVRLVRTGCDQMRTFDVLASLTRALNGLDRVFESHDLWFGVHLCFLLLCLI